MQWRSRGNLYLDYDIDRIAARDCAGRTDFAAQSFVKESHIPVTVIGKVEDIVQVALIDYRKGISRAVSGGSILALHGRNNADIVIGWMPDIQVVHKPVVIVAGGSGTSDLQAELSVHGAGGKSKFNFLKFGHIRIGAKMAVELLPGISVIKIFYNQIITRIRRLAAACLLVVVFYNYISFVFKIDLLGLDSVSADGLTVLVDAIRRAGLIDTDRINLSFRHRFPFSHIECSCDKIIRERYRPGHTC